MKVLVVDDSKYIRALVKEMLTKLGMESDGAEDGLVGAERIKSKAGDYSLVLLDWNMPQLDGVGMLDRLKNEGVVSPPIVMMTTEDDPQKIQTALEKGAVEYIIKPFTEDILAGKIKMVLGE